MTRGFGCLVGLLLLLAARPAWANDIVEQGTRERLAFPGYHGKCPAAIDARRLRVIYTAPWRPVAIDDRDTGGLPEGWQPVLHLVRGTGAFQAEMVLCCKPVAGPDDLGPLLEALQGAGAEAERGATLMATDLAWAPPIHQTIILMPNVPSVRTEGLRHGERVRIDVLGRNHGAYCYVQRWTTSLDANERASHQPESHPDQILAEEQGIRWASLWLDPLWENVAFPPGWKDPNGHILTTPAHHATDIKRRDSGP